MIADVTVAGYLRTNLDFHAEAYRSGYGIEDPEGHIVRCYHHVLRRELGMDGARGEKLLDFGCGNGTHTAYFGERGFDVYGVDSDERAIRTCRERFGHLRSRFAHVGADEAGRGTFFGGAFDVILANQVLYYLSASDFRRTVAGLHQQLREGGVIIATMIGARHYFFSQSQPSGDTMRTVTIDQRTVYINFVFSKDDLCARFHPFRPLHVGYYDFCILEHEGSRFHHLFVGVKG